MQGVLDRFGQIEPKVLFCADGYRYNGKQFDSLDEGDAEIARAAAERRGSAWWCDYLGAPAKAGTSLDEFLAPLHGRRDRLRALPFDHPLYILYSSGTTGVPKCIVHGAGGTLLQHLKEHRLHSDVKPGDRVFYFTTCGWMMWNWLVSGAGVRARRCCSTTARRSSAAASVLFDFADAEGITHFGTSAKFIDALAKPGLKPMRHASPRAAAHDALDRLAARARELRLRLPRT